MAVFDDMVRFLDLAWCARSQIVPCLIGPVGIGKTEAVLKHVENVGARRMVKIIASQILPNEVSGITMPDTETKAMEIYDHFRLSELRDGDVLFFDELLEADQLVLSACLTLIENRELMSGRKLPDIQIVAAANPTISAPSLKENIRQRFLFRRFGIDRQGCRAYIKRKYGINVEDLVSQLEETSSNYNILSQRSLTKMVEWMVSAEPDKRSEVADMIDSTWGLPIGTKIMKAIAEKDNSPERQIEKTVSSWLNEMAHENNCGLVRSYLSEAVIVCDDDEATATSMVADVVADAVDRDDFTEVSFTDMFSLLSKLPEWNDLESRLSSKEIEETKSDDRSDEILF